MDPGLWKLLNQGEGAEEVEVVLHLRDQDVVPPQVRVVTRFGDIATGRLRRDRIVETWAEEAVLSLKAPRLLTPEPALMAGEAGLGLEAQLSDSRRPPPLTATGQGVIVGVVDWGCDFAHPNFRHPDGSSRLLALWDQSNTTAPEQAAPYGYGAVFSQADINRALANSNPYEALGYHPARADPGGHGAHGTHVLDIAAGNGRAGGPAGVAPAADLVFVHLAARGVGGLANLGDSVRILEALDFVARLAGDRPWVINLSIGRCGGPHTGLTKVERGIDALLLQAPGRAIAQSTGNYFGELTHAADQLVPGQKRTLTWWTDQADVTPNELEVWYSGRDRLIVELRPPQSDLVVRVPLGEQAAIQIGAQEVGRIYHRARDPDRGDHHLDIFLDPAAPAGQWQVTLIGDDIVDGRFHAWVERDAACLGCQSRFDPDDAVPFSTTGTICNGFRTLAVGAYNPHAPDWPLAPFSSAGPTVDGRYRPHLVAPGVSILAARSAPPEPQIGAPLLRRMSGTSMAAPHVTGTIACMFQAAQRPLWIHETHRLLLNSTHRVSGSEELTGRIGNGYLDTERTVEAAQQFAAVEEDPASLTLAGVNPVNELKEEVCMNGESQERLNDAESLAADNSDEGVSAGAEVAAGGEVSDLVEAGYDLFEAEAEMELESPALFEDGCEEMIDDEAYFEAEDEDWEAEALFDPGYESREETELDDAWAPADYYGDEVEEIVGEATAPYLEAFEPSLVEQVDAVISSGEACRSSGELLGQVLSMVGVSESLNPLGSEADLAPLPALIFDALVPGGSPGLRRHFEQFFEAVALPGESLLDVFPQPGDILIRRALAEGNLAHTALVASEGMVVLRENGLNAESGLEGSYSQVMEAGPLPHPGRDQFFRRMTDDLGRLPLNQMILRVKGPFDERDWYTEDDFAESGPSRRWARCRRFTADDARWAPDSVSPDYRHLGIAGLSQPFTFEARHLERLCQLNHFNVTAGQDEVLFGLRGCMIIAGNGGQFAASVQLSEDEPDHFDYHCVLGVWKRPTGQIAVFRGSTVPNWGYMCRQVELGGRQANLLPTGRHIYRVGQHRAVTGAFRLGGQVVVLRSNNNLTYETTDYWDKCAPADNIHPSFSPTFAHFSSAGCQTVPGSFNGGHTGAWATFRQRAGLDPTNNRHKWGQRFVYVLLTGREARLVSSLSDPSSLTRLRFGSSDPSVEALQQALRQQGQYSGGIDGEMGPDTTLAYIRWQQTHDRGSADGIVIPAVARSLGFDINRLQSIAPADIFPETLDVARAVERNRHWANRLGWNVHMDAIVRLLHTEPFTPNQEEFARLVYEWQQRNGLTADGIIGPQTWQRMQPRLRLRPTTTPVSHPTGGSPHSNDISTLVAQARARFNVPEGGFRVGNQVTDFYRRSTILVANILERAQRNPEATRRQIRRALQAFSEDPSVRGSDIPIDLTFAIALSSREGGPDLVFSSSTQQVVSSGRDTHRQGEAGFDYLWNIRQCVPNYRQRLRPVSSNDPGLIRSGTSPAWLERRDVLIAGIAYAKCSEWSFRRDINRVFSNLSDQDRASLLRNLSLDAKRAWMQSKFGAPGFSSAALRYLKDKTNRSSTPVDLNTILTDNGLIEGRHALDRNGRPRPAAGFYIGRARVTAGEAWMLDQLNFAGQYSPTEAFGEELDVARAVQRNQFWGRRLGWTTQIDAIVRLLHTEPYTPGPEEFARLVYEWQQRHGLDPDGIIGPRTWRRMQPLIATEPTTSPPTMPPTTTARSPQRRQGPCYAHASRQSVQLQYFPVTYPQNFAHLLSSRSLRRNESRLIWFGQSFCNQRGQYFHHAIDIMGAQGMPIRTTSRQIVVNEWQLRSGGRTIIASGVRYDNVSSGPEAGRRGGNNVLTIDENGFVHYYAHMRDVPLVRPGDICQPGQAIGYMGNTGSGGIVHLHYQIRAPQPGSGRFSIEVNGVRYNTRGGAAVDPYDELVRLSQTANPPARRRGPHSMQYEFPIPGLTTP